MVKSIFGSGGGGNIVSFTHTPNHYPAPHHIHQPVPQHQHVPHHVHQPQPIPQHQPIARPAPHPAPQQPIPKKTYDSDVQHLRFPGYVTKAGSSTTKLTQGQGQGQEVSQIPYTKSYNIPQTYEAQLNEKNKQYTLIIDQLQSAKTVEDITRIKTVLSKLTSEIQLLKEKYKK